MLDEQALYTRLANPMWMERPDDWLWDRRGHPGQRQGWGAGAWRSNPGLSNLIWLSINLDQPPGSYDVNNLHLVQMLVTEGHAAKACGASLFDLAGLKTLHQFGALLTVAPERQTRVEKTYPLLLVYVNRRLHAHS